MPVLQSSAATSGEKISSTACIDIKDKETFFGTMLNIYVNQISETQHCI